jgi:hypothetical protein
MTSPNISLSFAPVLKLDRLHGPRVSFPSPVPQSMSKSDALLLAAHIVALADDEKGPFTFDDYLSEIVDKE